MAILILMRNPTRDQKYISQLKGLDAQTIAALNRVGASLLTYAPEPYWENEAKNELGYAFENQVSQPVNQSTALVWATTYPNIETQ